MKRIAFLAVTVMLMLSVLVFPVGAEESISDDPAIEEGTETAPPALDESTTEEEAETAPPAPDEFTTEETENGYFDQILAVVSDGTLWAKISAIVLGCFAIVASLNKGLGSVKSALSVLEKFIQGKASKEETEEALNKATSELSAEYKASHKELSQKYDNLCERNEQLTAILSLVVLNLVKSPNARVHIMSLISGTKKIGGDVVKTVEAIEAEIEKADAEEPKPDTPALDAIANAQAVSVENSTDVIPATNVVKLG